MEGEREKIIHGCERETSTSHFPYTPRPGIEPTTYVRAITGNRTGDLSVHWMRLNQLSHIGQGCLSFHWVIYFALKSTFSYIKIAISTLFISVCIVFFSDPFSLLCLYHCIQNKFALDSMQLCQSLIFFSIV